LQKTHVISIVLDNLCLPFIPRLFAGFEKGAEDFDKKDEYNLIYCGSNGSAAKKQRHINFLSQGRTDGIIIYGSLVSDDPIINNLKQSSLPLVLIENDLIGTDVNKILIDNEGGAYNATEYLIKLGHKKIAHIAGDINRKITTDRLNGYMHAMQANNIKIDPNLIIYPDYDEFYGIKKRENANPNIYYDIGYLKMKHLLSADRKPDAVFFATDILAFGAIEAIKEKGLSIPGDISLIGFDDERPGDFNCSFEPISTVRQPLERAAYEGIQIILENIENPDKKPETVILKTEMILRNSCAVKK
jgi:LacI family transcriptional regulator